MGRAEDLFQRIERDGESAIDEFIQTRASEELFLDFKRSADNGRGQRLHQNDRANLAKALSGFANSEGGVIVWGVDCRPGEDSADVAQAKRPIENVVRFVSLLEGAVSGCTVPSCPGVRSIRIERSERSGFAATLVPKSNRVPHRDIVKDRYFIRAGSDFVPVPHAVLAGMFGRRPQPALCHDWIPGAFSYSGGREILSDCRIIVVNEGRGIARDVFLTLDISAPGSPSVFRLAQAKKDVFDYYPLSLVGQEHTSAISKQSYKLPPGGRVEVVRLHIELRKPFGSGLSIRLGYGCEGAPTMEKTIRKSSDDLERIFSQVADLREAERQECFARELLDAGGGQRPGEREALVTGR